MPNDKAEELGTFLEVALQLTMLKFGDRISRITFEAVAGNSRESLTVHLFPEPAVFPPREAGPMAGEIRMVVAEMIEEKMREIPEIISNSQRRAM